MSTQSSGTESGTESGPVGPGVSRAGSVHESLARENITNEGIPATAPHGVDTPGVSDGKGNLPVYSAPAPLVLVREQEPPGPTAYTPEAPQGTTTEQGPLDGDSSVTHNSANAQHATIAQNSPLAHNTGEGTEHGTDLNY